MDSDKPKLSPALFNSGVKPTWCPGCGNFAILNAIRIALTEAEISPTDVLIVFDIGCNGNMADKINSYGFKGLHGRALPVAAGAKIANRKLHVIAISGDGGVLDEGMHHYIHSIRNNYDITFLMHNNCNFGLTTGQETPTTPKGQPMSATPWGNLSERLNPVQLALVSGATFVANAWTGDGRQMKDLIKESIDHKGFGLINIYQDCPTYNKFEDLAWLRERVVDVKEKTDYDPSNWEQAMKESSYNNEHRPVGIIYQDKSSVPYYDRVPYRSVYTTNLKDEVNIYDIQELQSSYL